LYIVVYDILLIVALYTVKLRALLQHAEFILNP